MRAEFRETTKEQYSTLGQAAVRGSYCLGSGGRREEVVTSTKTGVYGEGPLTGAVTLGRSTNPNYDDLAERKSRKYISRLTFLSPSYRILFPICQT